MSSIYDYSNPEEVRRMADKYLGKDVELYLSTRKNKKYMVQNPNGEWIHFGFYGMQDFTKHKDPRRRTLFRTRNHRWAVADKWTPSFLSYYLLW